MSTLRVGVLGAGIMGADHVNTLYRFVSGADPVMLADLDLHRAGAVAAEVPGLRITDDPLAVIEDPEVDAVIIATHDSTHADFAVRCLRAGKPVLCEKPLAPTQADCLRVVQTQRDVLAAGQPDLLSLGFMRRFDPGYADIKAAIVARELGAPLLMHAICRGVRSGPGTTSESAVTNSAIHDLDVLPWLVDEPVVQVSWFAPTSSGLAEGFRDPQIMLLRTGSGILCTVEMFLNARYGYDIRCEVVCETGTLALTEPAKVRRDADRTNGFRYAADWRPRFAEAYRLELQAWVDSIRSGTPSPMATAEDGLRAGAVAEAIIRSMRNGGGMVAVESPV